MTVDSRPRLRDTLLIAMRVAGSLTGVVVVIGLVASIIHLAKYGWTAFWASVPSGLAVGMLIVLSYFIAAAVAAPAYWVLKPLSKRWVGKMLLAGVLGFIIYGTVALTSVVAYVRWGINFMDYESPADVRGSLLPITVFAAVATAFVAPIVWKVWFRNGSRS